MVGSINDEKNFKTILHEKIMIKRDTRTVRSTVQNNKNYFEFVHLSNYIDFR